MNFIKKLIGKENSKSTGCCDVEIKEVEDTQEESDTTCCGPSDNPSKRFI